MPQTDEAQWWFHAVYSAVQQIPHGQCTSYGHIAALLGYPKRARQVGVCLKHLPGFDPKEPQSHFFHDENVPWQRVVNAKGGISPRGDGGAGAARQVNKLRAEGVEVHDGRAGDESWVDLAAYGWFPRHLPGEESDSENGEKPTNDE
jgi:methylated-DNA-protein-cysteine methyltransferase-like protein